MTTVIAKKGSNTVVIGQETIRRQLAESVRDGRAAHAYLFTGPGGVGKTAVSLEFAQLLLCDEQKDGPCGQCSQCLSFRTLQHPDLKIFFPLPPKKSSGSEDEEKEFAPAIAKVLGELSRDWYAPKQPPNAREIRLSLMRSMLHSVAMKPFQARRKVFLILRADTMNEHVQNTLLKSLEEPYPESYFLLVTENELGLRPTIRSRCQRVSFAPLATQEIQQALVNEGVPQNQADLAARLSGGSFVHARALAGPDIETLQESVVEFLRAASKCNPFEIDEASAKLLNTGSLPDNAGFELLGQFLRDAAMLRLDAASAADRLTFGNLADSVRAFMGAFPEADFEAAAAAVDESVGYLDRMYTKNMVCYALAIRLNRALGPLVRKKSSPKAIHHD